MGLFSTSTKTTNNPASWVRPQLEQSASAYGNLNTPEAYGGNWQAGLDPMLSGAWGNMYDNATGNQAMMGAMGTGLAGQGAMQGGMNFLNQLGQQAGDGGLFNYDQGTFDQTMGNLMPGLQGSYDAATRDNNRNLNWNTLPGLNMGNVGSGQEGGTKLGQSSALAQGMTMDRNADIGSGLYQNALNQANSNAMSAGQANLGANFDLLGQYGNYANMGLQGLNQGFNMNQGMLQNQLTAGQGAQNYGQQGLDYNRAQWDQQQTNPWLYEAQRLQNLTGTGSTFGTTKSSSTPGMGAIAAQLGGAALMGGMNPMAGMAGIGSTLMGGGGSPVGSLYDSNFSVPFTSNPFGSG